MDQNSSMRLQIESNNGKLFIFTCAMLVQDEYAEYRNYYYYDIIYFVTKLNSIYTYLHVCMKFDL